MGEGSGSGTNLVDLTVSIGDSYGMKLVLHKSAVKSLRKMQPKLAARIMDDLEAIAADPFAHHRQAKPLRDRPGYFRCEHGGWRALYRLDRDSGTMLVDEIDTRGDIY